MLDNFASNDLTHHFLIAMPGMEDTAFTRSVVYMCEHSERGALGIVINKTADLSLSTLFAKVDLPLGRDEWSGAPVFQGGPVHTERGFVLHDAQQAFGNDGVAQAVYASTMSIPGGLELTTSRDVLEAIANGGGPRRVLVSLGYAAWGKGQLESELTENSWLTVSADASVIFDTPVDERYARALALLGVDEWALCAVSGHA